MGSTDDLEQYFDAELQKGQGERTQFAPFWQPKNDEVIIAQIKRITVTRHGSNLLIVATKDGRLLAIPNHRAINSAYAKAMDRNEGDVGIGSPCRIKYLGMKTSKNDRKYYAYEAVFLSRLVAKERNIDFQGSIQEDDVKKQEAVRKKARERRMEESQAGEEKQEEAKPERPEEPEEEEKPAPKKEPKPKEEIKEALGKARADVEKYLGYFGELPPATVEKFLQKYEIDMDVDTFITASGYEIVDGMVVVPEMDKE